MHKSKVAAISVSVALAAMLGTALAAPAAAVGPEAVDEPHVTVEYFPEPGGEGRRTEVPVSTEAATGGGGAAGPGRPPPQPPARLGAGARAAWARAAR
ncbi:hypothetical protein ACFTXO_26505, partial [Streptomyces sp. NPDC057067]